MSENFFSNNPDLLARFYGSTSKEKVEKISGKKEKESKGKQDEEKERKKKAGEKR